MRIIAVVVLVLVVFAGQLSLAQTVNDSNKGLRSTIEGQIFKASEWRVGDDLLCHRAAVVEEAKGSNTRQGWSNDLGQDGSDGKGTVSIRSVRMARQQNRS